MQAVVLAAGKGTRMRSDTPKVLHEILGCPILGYVLDTLAQLGIKKPVVVIGAGAEQVKRYVGDRGTTVLQAEQHGTGHAVMMARKALAGYKGSLLIWPGDMPLVKLSTLREFIRNHNRSKADVSVLSSVLENPFGYGRILRAGGSFCGIREELDASEDERRIQEVNTGIYMYECPLLFEALGKLKPENKKNEYYLTDTIEILSARNRRLEAFPFASSSEGHGINSREDLAKVTQIMNERHVRELMASGVTFVSPSQTYVAPGVRIGQDSIIYPWTFIEENVKIGKRCHIGPFAKLRSGTVIGDDSTIGSFVEVNRSRLGQKVSAKHLAYLGDAVVGDESNIGAGTITANYDGRNKHQTRIGKKVLIGSNTVFVAPVNVSDQARTGAGSVLTANTKVKKGEVVAGVPARPLKKGSNR